MIKYIKIKNQTFQKHKKTMIKSLKCEVDSNDLMLL